MDKSKEYIFLCEMAKEIQDLWKPKEGDCFDSRGNTEYHGVRVLKITHNFKIQRVPKKKWNHIWLPRQDQLQDMLKEKYDMFNLLVTFYDWVRGQTILNKYKEKETYPTMEQLWLAFVMKEKYNRIWNKKEWEKENTNAKTN